MVSEMRSKTYGNAKIQGLTGMGKMQIIHLTQTGVIKPTEDKRGRGGRRKYSWENVIELMICKELRRYGMPIWIQEKVIFNLSLSAHMVGKGGPFSFWEIIKKDPDTDFKLVSVSISKISGIEEFSYGIIDRKKLIEDIEKNKIFTNVIIDISKLIEEIERKEISQLKKKLKNPIKRKKSSMQNQP